MAKSSAVAGFLLVMSGSGKIIYKYDVCFLYSPFDAIKFLCDL